MQELDDLIRYLANGKAVGPGGVPVEVFKISVNCVAGSLGEKCLATVEICRYQGVSEEE